MYPPKWVKESVLFNLNADSDPADSGLILVRDPQQVLVLAEPGFSHSIAFLNEMLSEEQLRLLPQTCGAGGKITLFCAKDDEYTVENLTRLLPLFFVRLVRYDRKETSEAGFAVDELGDLLSWYKEQKFWPCLSGPLFYFKAHFLTLTNYCTRKSMKLTQEAAVVSDSRSLSDLGNRSGARGKSVRSDEIGLAR